MSNYKMNLEVRMKSGNSHYIERADCTSHELIEALYIRTQHNSPTLGLHNKEKSYYFNGNEVEVIVAERVYDPAIRFVAGNNHIQSAYWAKNLNFDSDSWKYVARPTDLYGFQGPEVEIHFVGEYHKREDLKEILDMCRTRGFTQIRHA